MIRFRSREDEQRFLKLHAEMFERVARAGLPAEVGSETMRNVGKIEQLAYLEGLRQGLAMAAIAQQMIELGVEAIPPPHSFKAFQLHALLYGSADTPLRAVEKEWLEKLDLDPELLAGSWLDDKPMRFAPATNQEVSGVTPPIAPMISVRSATKPQPVAPPLPPDEAFQQLARDLRADLNPDAGHGAEVTPLEPWEKGEYEPDSPSVDEIVDEIMSRKAQKEPITNENPDLLDDVRTQMQQMRSSGWNPQDWTTLILDLSRAMKRDAGFLDLQLTTDVGRAVLAQCGLLDVAPPSTINIMELNELLSVKAAP